MKKLFTFFTFFLLILSFSFAEKARFYKDGKVIDIMYVDSEDGLRVRDKPSLKSNRLCALPHRLPVKIVAIGKEETIDGLTDPWVEILLPRYEWKTDEPEYGWVFGGYIQNNQADFKIPQTAQQLEDYLKRANWTLLDTKASSAEDHFNFYTSNYYEYVYSKTKNIIDADTAWFFQNYDDDDNQSTWKVLNNHQIEIHWYIPSSTNRHKNPINKVEVLEVKPVSDGVCFINGTKYLNKPFENRHHWSYYDAIKMPLIYNNETYNDNNKKSDIVTAINSSIFGYTQEDYSFELRHELLEELLKYGIPAKGSYFETEYRNYWDRIMSEHQKNADSY